MKKLFFGSICTLVFCLFIISCKQTPDKTREAKDDMEEVEQVSESFEDIEDLTSSVPSFVNSAVQDYVNSYEAYLDEYAKAVESKDLSALSDLAPKGKELAIKAQEVSGKMSVEDAQKFTHYMTEKAKMIQELTLRMTD